MKFQELGAKALRTIGAWGQGVNGDPNDMQVAFEAANDMIDAWAAQRLTIFQTLQKNFPIVANQGSTSNPYTIGLGGDFDVQRPTFIPNASLLVTTSPTNYQIPLSILTPDDWAWISMQNLSSALAQALYYDGKWDTSGADAGLGQIFLYPVPNGQTTMTLNLYLPTPMRGFADIDTTEYTFPPGYSEALRYQLAKRLSSEFKKPMTAEDLQLTVDTFAVIQRPNAPVPHLVADFGLAGSARSSGLYNWRTGQITTRPGGG